MRIFRGYLQREFANMINMPLSTYQQKEHGKIKIKIHELREMAKVLNCSIDKILYGEDKK